MKFNSWDGIQATFDLLWHFIRLVEKVWQTIMISASGLEHSIRNTTVNMATSIVLSLARFLGTQMETKCAETMSTEQSLINNKAASLVFQKEQTGS